MRRDSENLKWLNLHAVRKVAVIPANAHAAMVARTNKGAPVRQASVPVLIVPASPARTVAAKSVAAA